MKKKTTTSGIPGLSYPIFHGNAANFTPKKLECALKYSDHGVIKRTPPSKPPINTMDPGIPSQKERGMMSPSWAINLTSRGTLPAHLSLDRLPAVQQQGGHGAHARLVGKLAVRRDAGEEDLPPQQREEEHMAQLVRLLCGAHLVGSGSGRGRSTRPHDSESGPRSDPMPVERTTWLFVRGSRSFQKTIFDVRPIQSGSALFTTPPMGSPIVPRDGRWGMEVRGRRFGKQRALWHVCPFSKMLHWPNWNPWADGSTPPICTGA